MNGGTLTDVQYVEGLDAIFLGREWAQKSADPLGVSEYIELSYVADLAIRPLFTAKVTGWPSDYLSEISCPAKAAVAMDFFLFYRGAPAEQKHAPEGMGGGGRGLYPHPQNGSPKDYLFPSSKSSKMRVSFDLKTAPHVVPLRQSKSTSLSSSKVNEKPPPST